MVAVSCVDRGREEVAVAWVSDQDHAFSLSSSEDGEMVAELWEE